MATADTPAAEPLPVPSPETTKRQIEDIAVERNKEATAALTQLCEQVIRAVTQVDNAYNVGHYFKVLSVHCDGRGAFRLEIEEQNAEIDHEAIARSVAAVMAADKMEFGKPLRHVQLESGGIESGPYQSAETTDHASGPAAREPDSGHSGLVAGEMDGGAG